MKHALILNEIAKQSTYCKEIKNDLEFYFPNDTRLSITEIPENADAVSLNDITTTQILKRRKWKESVLCVKFELMDLILLTNIQQLDDLIGKFLKRMGENVVDCTIKRPSQSGGPFRESDYGQTIELRLFVYMKRND